MVLYKITNKALVSFMFWEPLIIIDDQWLRKYKAHWRFIDEALPCGIGFIANIVMMSFTGFFIFFVSSRTRTYSFRYGLWDQKKTKVCTFWNESE